MELDDKDFITSIWEVIDNIKQGQRILMSADTDDFYTEDGEVKWEFINKLQHEFIGENLPEDVYVTIRFRLVINPSYLGIDIYRRND